MKQTEITKLFWSKPSSKGKKNPAESELENGMLRNARTRTREITPGTLFPRGKKLVWHPYEE